MGTLNDVDIDDDVENERNLNLINSNNTKKTKFVSLRSHSNHVVISNYLDEVDTLDDVDIDDDVDTELEVDTLKSNIIAISKQNW